MVMAGSLQTPLKHSFALLFTDARGQVVFADHLFDRLTRRGGAGVVPGEPLHVALHADQLAAEKLIGDAHRSGRAEPRAVSFKTITGTLRDAWGVGIAAYDESKAFIGADILLSTAEGANAIGVQSLSHTDVLALHFDQVMIDAMSEEHKTFLQVYFVSQIDALFILLGRFGGPAMADVVEQVINHTARHNGWPIAINRRQVAFARTSIVFSAYGQLLRQAVDYAVGAVGRGTVARELRMIDAALDPGLRNLVTDVGLRIPLDG